MNICLVNSNAGFGGAERVFLELAIGFQEKGHRVTFVCRPGSVLAQRLPRTLDIQLMQFRNDFDLGTAVSLYRLYRARQFDVVFCDRGRDCKLAGVAARANSIPVVKIKQTVGGSRSLNHLLVHRVLASAVVSVSNAVQDSLAGLGIPPERRHVIYNGISVAPPSIDRASARVQFGINDAEFAVAYTGRLAWEKGVDLLPQVTCHAIALGLPMRLLIAGDGPLRSTLEATFRALQVDRHVSFLGFVQDPLPVLIASDAAVLPSRSEAFPLAALEALLMGTPLVACRVGGLPEVATAGESALMVPPEDPLAMATALARLHSDRGLAERLRDRGRERAAAFTRDRMIEQYEQLIHRLHRQSSQGR
jgi:glycosyltransferase involved in cell wall biosynthesis